MDIVWADGWLEAPARPWEEKWLWHPGPKAPWWGASVPSLVVDLNHDGIKEMIVGNAHGYGLEWCSRRKTPAGLEWDRHPIDPYEAQYHDLQWADINGDGECELVTGKRYRAHCGGEAGEWDDCGIYYFKWNGESFTKIVVDPGPIGDCG